MWAVCKNGSETGLVSTQVTAAVNSTHVWFVSWEKFFSDLKKIEMMKNDFF